MFEPIRPAGAGGLDGSLPAGFRPNGAHGVLYHGQRFGSASEAACGVLLEKYVPGFKLHPHRTFQVPVYDFDTRVTRTVDFKVGEIFLEFHPPRFWRSGSRYGDFATPQEYFDYRAALRDANSPEVRRNITKAVREKLTARYTALRRRVLDANEETRGAPLVVVTTPEEIHSFIRDTLRFPVPDQRMFVSEFRAHQRRASKLNKVA